MKGVEEPMPSIPITLTIDILLPDDVDVEVTADIDVKVAVDIDITVPAT